MTTSADKKPWNLAQKSLLPKPSSYSTFSKKLQSEAKSLEIDNQKMEEKLNAFKEYLKSQKEKRLHADKIWSGGEVHKGSLSQYAQNVLAKKKSFRRDSITNINFLKNDSSPNLTSLDKKGLIPKPPSAPKTTSKSELIGKDLWRIPSSLGKYPIDPPKKSYAERINSLNSNQSQKKDLDKTKEQTIIQSDSLLKGSYDENNSHLSFQQALKEWRGESDSKNSEFSKVIVQLGSTQTNFDLETEKESLKELEKKVQVLLVDDKSLSYMEKLLLAKLKDSKDEDLDSKDDDLDSVDSILEETPPAGFESFDSHTLKEFEIITIQGVLNDECDFYAQVLDSSKIIIEEPLD